MKKLLQLLLAGSILFTASCSKKDDLTPQTDNGGSEEIPVEKDFNVTTTATTFKIGERVRFGLEGNPEAIDFYSGEIYSDYSFKDGRTGTVFNPVLSFLLHTPSNTRRDQFFVMVSNDFDGDYSSLANVKASNWENATSKMTFPTQPNVYTTSGNMDLSQYAESGKPFYLAFKYVNAVNPDNSVSVATWTVRNLMLKNSLPGNIKNLAGTNPADFSFTTVKQNQNSGTTNLTSADRFPLTGNAAAPGEEFWIISKAFQGEEIDLGPDKPTPIKSLGNSKLSNYSFVYEKAGVYQATFVATIREPDGTAKIVTKNIALTIVP